MPAIWYLWGKPACYCWHEPRTQEICEKHTGLLNAKERRQTRFLSLQVPSTVGTESRGLISEILKISAEAKYEPQTFFF